MIDYVSVHISDIEVAATFYNAVLATLSYKQHAKFANVIAYGKDDINFIATLPIEHHLPTKINLISSPIHIAFTATSIKQVDEFHDIALICGGISERKPTFCDHPCGEVYSTGIRDVFGHKLEAIYKQPGT